MKIIQLYLYILSGCHGNEFLSKLNKYIVTSIIIK